ncbi:MAG TPA: hypothetical protein VFC03_08660 [Acidimicrobiales bacterium]|nr:hypothetical protein [Acidimicrobiales bacterium]
MFDRVAGHAHRVVVAKEPLPHRCWRAPLPFTRIVSLAADRRAPDGLQRQSKLHPRQTIERAQRLRDEGTTADDYDATEHHPAVRGNPTSYL